MAAERAPDTGRFCVRRAAGAARIFRFLVAAFSAAAYVVQGAYAATVSLEISSTYSAESNTVSWVIKNCGGETADSVRVSVQEPGGAVSSGYAGFIDPGMCVTGSLCTASVSGLLDGSLVVPVFVEYEDRTGRKWKTFSLAASEGQPLNAGVSVGICAPSEDGFYNPADGVPGIGTMSVSGLLYGRGSGTREVRLRVFAPSGIVPEFDEYRIEADEFGVFSADVRLENRLHGACGTFPVAAVADCAAGNGAVLTGVGSAELQGVRPLTGGVPGPVMIRPQTAAILALALICLSCFSRMREFDRRFFGNFFDAAIVAAVTGYVAYLVDLPAALSGGLCVGGDTPAHHYLVSHTAQSGRCVSWASGWWCGFPMFRFYFPLPYCVIAMLTKIFPHDAVFNAGMCSGMVLLPASMYAAARTVMVARPLPVMAACCMLPLLADNTHNMWGVNFYSTLAGMIANSWSFALLPLALACALRDGLDKRIRLRTPLLIAAVALSHFFTAVMLCIMLGAVCAALFLRGRDGVKGGFTVIADGMTGALLSAWWVVPLAARSRWSVDFGSQWEIDFFRQLHPFILRLFIPALAAAAAAELVRRMMRRREWAADGGRGILIWCLFFSLFAACSTFLFFYGRHFSEVFVNCRLWPFIIFGLLGVCSGAFAYAGRVAPALFSCAWLVLCAGNAWNTTPDEKNPVWSFVQCSRIWAQYNFSGLDSLKDGAEGRRIAATLRGTPGRMSQDLHEGNTALGSSRFFEIMPYLAAKSVIEGGIVNSALGSLAAYTVQGEVSDSTAGYPLMVKPRKFDPESGLRHLELMNVRHFVARSHAVKEAFLADPGWRRKESFADGKWVLFEAADPADALVRVWKKPLEVYESDDFKRDLLEWMYCRSMTDRPCILVAPGEAAPAGAKAGTHSDFVKMLEAASVEKPPDAGWEKESSEPSAYRRTDDGGIVFDTTHIGEPHLIAESWFPDWTVSGAGEIFFVTPGYMAVYPDSEHVELRREAQLPEKAGMAMTWAGVILCAGMLFCGLRRRFAPGVRRVRQRL